MPCCARNNQADSALRWSPQGVCSASALSVHDKHRRIDKGGAVTMATGGQASLPVLKRSTVQVLEKIGRGSFGSVFKCKFNNQTCALKELNPGSTSVSHSWLQGRLRKEIEVLHRVSSSEDGSKFVRVLATCTNDQGQVSGYIMEYCEFGNMRSFLNRLKGFNLECQRFPYLSLRLLHQVAEGLKYLHEAGPSVILHKDVAIDNIFINSSLSAKLGDFGLARTLTEAMGQDTQHFETLVGIERRPPELLLNPLRAPDKYVDRFLFGVCILEALTCSSLRHRIGTGVSDYRASVLSGAYMESLVTYAESDCFDIYPARLRDSAAEEFKRTREIALKALRDSIAPLPEQRPTFTQLCSRLAEVADSPEAKREAGLALALLKPPPAVTGNVAAVAGAGGPNAGTRTTQESLDSMLNPSMQWPQILDQAGQPSVLSQTLGRGGTLRVAAVEGRVFDLASPLVGASLDGDAGGSGTRLSFASKPAPKEMLTAVFRYSALRDTWPEVLKAMGAPSQAVTDAALFARRSGLRDSDAALDALKLLPDSPAPPTVRQLAQGLEAASCGSVLTLLSKLQSKYCSPVTTTSTLDSAAR